MAGLKFRILLDSPSKKEVFRDIVIDDESSFEEFYKVIHTSFGFTGDQMASFYVSDAEWNKGHEITLMDVTYDEDDNLADQPDLMRNVKLRNFVSPDNVDGEQKFILVYDFLLLWIFLIELIGYEKDTPTEPKVILEVGIAPEESSRNTDEITMETYGMELEDEEMDEYDDEEHGGYEEDYDYY